MAMISPRARTRRPTTFPRSTNGKAIPELHNGDRLTQKEFHRRYEAYPEDVKIELIGGIVYMASPAGTRHGRHHFVLRAALALYDEETPGVEGLVGPTTILGEESEPQPDLAMRILPECGGHTRTKDNYIHGAPEWLSEIAHSTEAIDLGQKREDYRKAGVVEYVVVCLREQEIRWFDFRKGQKLRPGKDGLYRSRILPRLWVDGEALLDGDLSRLLKGVRKGLASPEHAAFVRKLEAARRKKK